MKLNTTTTQRPNGLHSSQGSISTGGPGSAHRDLSIGHLDLRDAGSQGEIYPEGRVLWVSLINPRSLLGPLLDEMSFEGAWLETDGQARIRLLGQSERRVSTPLFHSPETARQWLASELLKSASGPGGLGFQDSPDAGPERLAA